MSVSGEKLVSLLQTTDQLIDQPGKLDDDPLGGGGIPNAGFAVKTRDELGQKLFLNVCSSPLVPLPPLWPSTTSPFSTTTPSSSTLGTLITTYLTGTPPPDQTLDPSLKNTAEAALAIPMHLSSPPRSTVDHLGITCTVLDCVVNPLVLDATSQSRPFKMFLVQLSLGEAEKILSIQLDPQFKLPKMKFKGELAPLDISVVEHSKEKRDSILLEGKEEKEKEEETKVELRLPSASRAPSSIIEEQNEFTKDFTSTTKPKKVTLIEEEIEEKQQIIKQVKVTIQGKPRATAAVVSLSLPSSSSSSSSYLGLLHSTNTNSVQITSEIDSVTIALPGCTPVIVPLPLAVHADQATAILSKEKKLLTITLPFASFEEVKTWNNER